MLAALMVALLTVIIWACVGIIYMSGLALGFASIIIGLLGTAVMMSYSPHNGFMLLMIAFLLSPFGLPRLACLGLSKLYMLRNMIRAGIRAEKS